MTGYQNKLYPGNECNEPRTRKAEKELERYHMPILKSIGVAWEDAEYFTIDREAWHERVAQCVLIDTG